MREIHVGYVKTMCKLYVRTMLELYVKAMCPNGSKYQKYLTTD